MGLGIVVVEVCDSNLLSALELEDLETLYPEVSVLRLDCLSFCGLCRLRPYAIVNGKRVFAKTTEECVERIKQTIESELAAFYEE
ncbi:MULTISPECIES: DUF1450 domain-containing protein [unclassified Paenibacillus]|uniref:DUF1450 domain-containing protein n=1 Tax=unclassified Paenibacillus TaxID=185978 RepID=UPI001C128DCA|nr:MULTISPECIES: DUF1450 domain-containing protein [unclassified Paenibacillus]MBU5441306.1 YuzB family protein [Paenibacillus sp. MSJ-34]CAH0120872.1 hypothetical protein PAE9249_03396 [Paenibacillus sp. CECT 9249]